MLSLNCEHLILYEMDFGVVLKVAMKGKRVETKDFDTITKNLKTCRIRWSKRAYIKNDW